MPCILTIPTAIPLHCLELHFTLPFSYLLRETPASVLQSGPGPKRLVTAFLHTAGLNSSSSQAGRRQRLTLHRHEFRWVWNKPRVDLCRAKLMQQKGSSRSEKAWDSGVHGPVSICVTVASPTSASSEAPTTSPGKGSACHEVYRVQPLLRFPPSESSFPFLAICASSKTPLQELPLPAVHKSVTS